MAEKLDLAVTYKTIMDAARGGRFVSYGQIAKANGVDWNEVRYEVNNHLGKLLTIAAERKWPLPSALVVNQNNIETGLLDGTARDGFINAAKAAGYDVHDPQAFVADQQSAMFEWAKSAPDTLFPTDVADTFDGPQFVRYFGVVLDALRALGGEGTPRAVMDKVRELADVPIEELEERTAGGAPKYENKIGWARFYLMKAGLIDGSRRGVWVLTAEGRETTLNHAAAHQLFKDVRTQFDTEGGDPDEAPPPNGGEYAPALFDDPNRRFWYVGALWGNEDQTDRFIKEGVWQNGYDEKFTEVVGRMRSGDRIALKSSFTQKYDLPFDVGGKTVSCMRIKAIGTVLSESSDGRTVKVEWTPLSPPRTWYFYTFRTTINEVTPSEDLAKRLILFTFANERQDIGFWLRVPYFAKKYSQLAKPAEGSGPIARTEEATADDPQVEPYDIDNIVTDGCFLAKSELEAALERLRQKKNLILQGAPGTGKTWLAKRLAYALIGTRDAKVARAQLRVIQFHPSLSYEDFVRGWRPDGGGTLSLVDGAFLEAVQAAEATPDQPVVVVIEEINRGNPAQIFGEMLTLLENTKRHEDEAIELAYRRFEGERVSIPPNLYVVGTMNIADRSLALVDLALRRRFAFVTLGTLLNDAWRTWCTFTCGLPEDFVTIVAARLNALNEQIASDTALGNQFRIGHSYVTPAKGDRIEDPRSWYLQVVETELEPLLQEYWYDNASKARAAVQALRSGI